MKWQFILFLIILPVCYAELTFTTPQSEWYFKLGDNAVIPIQYNLTDKNVNGLFTYTITQSSNQQGMQYQNTNSQTKTASLIKGIENITLNMGASKQPIDIDLDIKYQYDDITVTLNDIKIHFVEDPEKQQQQQQEQKQSQSNQKQSESEQQNMNGDKQKPIEPKQPENPDASTKMQNNQMNQDMNAQKQQMQEDIKKQQEMKEEFQKQLEQNEELAKAHQEMLDKGYNQTSGEMNPESNNTGDFKFNYEKDGMNASIKGKMQNGTMKNLEMQSDEAKEEMLNQLEQNPKFQKFQKELQQDDFNQSDIKITQDANNTEIEFEYKNEKNETATIKAEFEDEKLKEIKLYKKKNYWILPITTLLLTLLFIIYKKTRKEDPQRTLHNFEVPFNYRKAAKELLERSKEQFKERPKDAYGTAGQAIRLYLSHKHNIKKELTNDEVIKTLKRKKEKHKDTKTALDLTSLVEFAKYKTNEKDFNVIIKTAKKIIK